MNGNEICSSETIYEEPETKNSKRTCVWFFGRGASLACDLNWDEPKKQSREERIKFIEDNIRAEMDEPCIKKKAKDIYGRLLSILDSDTNENWEHLFVTTNWDYLLQREIDNYLQDNYLRPGKANKLFPHRPPWGIVYPLNGTVEDKGAVEDRRKQFVLVDDDGFKLTDQSLEKLRRENVPGNIIDFLKELKDQKYKNEEEFIKALEKTIGKEDTETYKSVILNHAEPKESIREKIIDNNPPLFRMSFSQILYKQLFIAVGISFNYIVDQIILELLNKNLDEIESRWIIVDPKYEEVGSRITRYIRGARFRGVSTCKTSPCFIRDWILINDMQELREAGFINSKTVLKNKT